MEDKSQYCTKSELYDQQTFSNGKYSDQEFKAKPDTDKPSIPVPAVVDVTSVSILGISLNKLSHPVQFGVCFFGIVFFYLLYGYSQEWIFRVEGFKYFGWYLTLVQFIFYSFFGLTEIYLKGETQRRIPMTTYIVISFLTVATMGLSNSSLGYLNFPTQVIFKSCKLIPVMIGGVLIQGKRYTVLNVVAMLLMCIGLILFNLADSSVQPVMDHTGILLISLALCADAVIGNVQEKAMKEHSASSVEMILYSYSIGIIYILVWVVISGSLVPAFSFCLKNPRIYFMTAIFSFTGYIGVNFVLALVKLFGALLAVTVTTFRKTITVVLSFLLFSKPFTLQYVWSGLIILLGIALNVYCKNSGTINKLVDKHLLRVKEIYLYAKHFGISLLSGQEGIDALSPKEKTLFIDSTVMPDRRKPDIAISSLEMEHSNQGLQPVEVIIDGNSKAGTLQW